jgi:hypothetical protein
VPAIIIASPQFQAALQQEGDIVSKLATLDPAQASPRELAWAQ